MYAALWSQAGCDGTGRLYLVGCGYNAYPAGSQYAEYPQMDTKQQDRQRRKYRFIVHAEQSALTFRSEPVLERSIVAVVITTVDRFCSLWAGLGRSEPGSPPCCS